MAAASRIRLSADAVSRDKLSLTPWTGVKQSFTCMVSLRDRCVVRGLVTPALATVDWPILVLLGRCFLQFLRNMMCSELRLSQLSSVLPMMPELSCRNDGLLSCEVPILWKKGRKSALSPRRWSLYIGTVFICIRYIIISIHMYIYE
jgi:hypothetical protein